MANGTENLEKEPEFKYGPMELDIKGNGEITRQMDTENLSM